MDEQFSLRLRLAAPGVWQKELLLVPETDYHGPFQARAQVNFTQVAFGRVTVGAWVAPSFRRKGYSLRSLNAVVDWLRTEKSVFRVDAFVHEANEASYRVLEKAGFEREGVLRNWEVIDGKSRDMLSYAYLIDRS